MWITQSQIITVNEKSVFNFPLEYTGDLVKLHAGSFPDGVSLDPNTGLIFGTAPIVDKTTAFPFTLRLFSGNEIFDLGLTILVSNNEPMWISPQQLPQIQQFEYVEKQLEIFDPRSSDLNFTMISGRLPEGLTLLSNGKIVGQILDQIGNYSFTVKETISGLVRNFLLPISNETPNSYWITLGGWIGDIRQGQFFQFQFQSTGSVYELDPDSTLPNGLSLDSSGFLSGVYDDTFIGSNKFTVLVDGIPREFLLRSNVIFDQSLLDLSLQTETILIFSMDKNEKSSFTIPNTGVGNIHNYTLTSGSLPSGLAIQQNTGHIIGRPTESGLFDFTVEVINNFGTTIIYFVSLTIRDNNLSMNQISFPLTGDSKKNMHNLITSYIPYDTTFRPSDRNFGLTLKTDIELFEYSTISSNGLYNTFKNNISLVGKATGFKLLPVQNSNGRKVCEAVVLIFEDSNPLPSNTVTSSMNTVKDVLITNNNVPFNRFLDWQSNEYQIGQNNTLRIVDHGIETGEIVMFKNQALQPPLTNNTIYYAIKVNNDLIALASTKQFAETGTRLTINIPSNQTGMIHTRYNGIPIIYCNIGRGILALRYLRSLNFDISSITFRTNFMKIDDEMVFTDEDFVGRI